MISRAEGFVRRLLSKADVEVGGSRPWDITVHDPRFYKRILRYGTLGVGESYMDGWWDAPSLDEFIKRVLRADLKKHIEFSVSDMWLGIEAAFFNLQSRSRAFTVGEEHYDIGNDLYKAMLDPRMVYTCGYWSGTPRVTTLAEAQEAKLDLVCKKIGLKEGDRILDIGCGWGSFAKFAAEKYGAHVTGITVSKEQVALGTELCKGLPVELKLMDYRQIDEKFDHVVSLGMFEHVGYKNYRTYMEIVRRCLKGDGLFLLHTIGGRRTRYAADPWFDKYIFPNGMLPSVMLMGKAIERLFVMEDWHNFGADYDKTLMAWFANFDAEWPTLKATYGDRFYRMWKYYLLSMAGAFRSRVNNQLWQIVLSPRGVEGGYHSIR